jgi:RadC-like JAB domain
VIECRTPLSYASTRHFTAKPAPSLMQFRWTDAAPPHPSGDPEPSAEDVALTRRLAAAGQLLGIELLDHLILGEAGRFVSLRERGVL